MICGFYSLYSLIVFRQQHWKSRLVALIFAIALDRARPELCRQSSQRYEQSGHFIWLLFVLGGISRIVNGCQTRKQSGAGWNIFIGLLDLLIACLWLAMNPQQSWLFITAFIGVEMIFSAIGLLVLRNKMKHAQA